MSRREIREQIFKILFRIEFHTREEMEEQAALCLKEIEGISDKDLQYISQKVMQIVQRVQELDEMINGAAQKWKTTRMGKAELTLIRLAVYEMKFEEDIPVSVAINEAVELAKIYSTDNGAGFVNGILAKLV